MILLNQLKLIITNREAERSETTKARWIWKNQDRNKCEKARNDQKARRGGEILDQEIRHRDRWRKAVIFFWLNGA